MSGLKGKVLINTADNVEVGTAVPANKVAATTITITNLTDSPVKVSVAITQTAPSWLLEDLVLDAEYLAPRGEGSPIVLSRIPMSGGESVIVITDAGGVAVQRRAFEEDV
jgi:hypothetical protein